MPASYKPKPSNIHLSHTLYPTQDGRLPPHQPTTIIFDLGDVLFTWSPSVHPSPVSPETFKAILRSASWLKYEQGKLSRGETYSLVSKQFEVSPSDLDSAFRVARQSLTVCSELLSQIREFRAMGLKIYAMSNIAGPEWEILKTSLSPSDWSLFDQVFISSQVGERKPNLGFYYHVLSEINEDPTRIIFVDDKLENVFSARSLGMYGIVFDNATNVIRQLQNLVHDPLRRAKQYLEQNKKQLLSYTSTGVILDENCAQLVILEVTGDQSLVNYIRYEREWNYFQGKGKLTTEDFPPDLDSTSLAFTILPDIPDSLKHEIMDQMLEQRTADGITEVYFGQSRPRIDPVTCLNTLTLFYRHGRGDQLKETFEWVKNILIRRAYLGGTYYYLTADCFLYFFSRFLVNVPEVYSWLNKELRQAISERFGAPGDALALAMRIIAASNMGMVNTVDLPALLSLQQEDGRFTGYFYRYPSTGILIGNDGAATALAIEAIKLLQLPRNRSKL